MIRITAALRPKVRGVYNIPNIAERTLTLRPTPMNSFREMVHSVLTRYSGFCGRMGDTLELTMSGSISPSTGYGRADHTSGGQVWPGEVLDAPKLPQFFGRGLHHVTKACMQPILSLRKICPVKKIVLVGEMPSCAAYQFL
jgi:hypothetical protein